MRFVHDIPRFFTLDRRTCDLEQVVKFSWGLLSPVLSLQPRGYLHIMLVFFSLFPQVTPWSFVVVYFFEVWPIFELRFFSGWVFPVVHISQLVFPCPFAAPSSRVVVHLLVFLFFFLLVLPLSRNRVIPFPGGVWVAQMDSLSLFPVQVFPLACASLLIFCWSLVPFIYTISSTFFPLSPELFLNAARGSLRRYVSRRRLVS